MKKLLIIVLLAFITITFAETATDSFVEHTTGSEKANFEIINNWQALAVLALLLSSVLVAIAYMIGTGLEMPELQAWAKTEFVQIITNAILILALFVTIAFINLIVLGVAYESNLGLEECNILSGATGGVDCLRAVTTNYLDVQITDTMEKSAKTVLESNTKDSAWAARRFGINCISLVYCVQLGINMGFFGHYALNTDMYAIVFEHYTNLLAFIAAQRFFVEQISFKMAPAILAVGIVARSFFFTRKLGGLLMAIAIGCMFFFPGMYIFDWVTMDMATNGDTAGTDQDPTGCPSECIIPAPLAYAGNTVIKSEKEMYLAFNPEDNAIAKGLIDGTIEIAVPTNASSPYAGVAFSSCNIKNPAYGYDKCPKVCRELPYPVVSDCVVQNDTDFVAKSCAMLPAQCKIKRLVPVANQDAVEAQRCPASCKITPPLKSDCRSTAPDDGDFNDITEGDDCLESSYDCRMAKSNLLSWRPTKPGVDEDIADKCALAGACAASTVATQSCVYVVPPTGLCRDMCIGCPPECRIAGFENLPPDQLPPSCRSGENHDGGYLALCSDSIFGMGGCPEGCKVTMDELEQNKDEAEAAGKCISCIAKRLIVSNSPPLPYNYNHGTCEYDICPVEYRSAIPRTACEMCIFAEEQYMYNPPINPRCPDLCRPSDRKPVSDSSSLTKIGPDGLVGKPMIQDVAKFMIPVYLLPLFNIVATLIFIRSLSHFLGGDIEIPGINKVF